MSVNDSVSERGAIILQFCFLRIPGFIVLRQRGLFEDTCKRCLQLHLHAEVTITGKNLQIKAFFYPSNLQTGKDLHCSTYVVMQHKAYFFIQLNADSLYTFVYIHVQSMNLKIDFLKI